jgi:hypothetical protein
MYAPTLSRFFNSKMTGLSSNTSLSPATAASHSVWLDPAVAQPNLMVPFSDDDDDDDGFFLALDLLLVILHSVRDSFSSSGGGFG